MEREACVCDHGYERSDLCAEIIIIIIIVEDRPKYLHIICTPLFFIFYCRALPCSKRCGRTHSPTVYLILIIV